MQTWIEAPLRASNFDSCCHRAVWSRQIKVHRSSGNLTSYALDQSQEGYPRVIDMENGEEIGRLLLAYVGRIVASATTVEDDVLGNALDVYRWERPEEQTNGKSLRPAA
jgi:hypothetical protein